MFNVQCSMFNVMQMRDGYGSASSTSHIAHRTSHITFRGRGFTLIELLVVIAIIALLLGILVPAVNWARKNSETSATRQYMGAISLGLQAYQQDFNAFPPSVPPSGVFCGVSSMTNWKGANMLAQAMVGLSDSFKTGPGFQQTANSKTYGPYLNTGSHGISGTGPYNLIDAWDLPIQYYRANLGATSTSQWWGSSTTAYRFNSADNNSAPSQAPADSSTLASAKFLLISIGADGKSSTTSDAADNVVVTGP